MAFNMADYANGLLGSHIKTTIVRIEKTLTPEERIERLESKVKTLEREMELAFQLFALLDEEARND